jgi:hypothetical protein
LRAGGPTAPELAARAVDDDRCQDEHHAGDDDQVDDVIAALVARVVAGCGQKRKALYR